MLLVVAHPVIASGIETLLKLEGRYEIRRVPSIAEGAAVGAWADVALVDGALLAAADDARLGTPAYVLSGNERDGRALARKLDDARGWLRKDATAAELRDAIRRVAHGEESRTERLGTLGVLIIVALVLVVLGIVAYLVRIAAA